MKNLFFVAAFLFAAAFSPVPEFQNVSKANTSDLTGIPISLTEAQDLAFSNPFLIVIDEQTSTLQDLKVLTEDRIESILLFERGRDSRRNKASTVVMTSSTSLQGSRAANGVINIITRRGNRN